MRDGVKLARQGIPAVALVTSEFWAQGDFVARSVGMPDVPRVMLPHPVAATGVENIRRVADSIRDAVLAGLARRRPSRTGEGEGPDGA
ncbi:MAG: hypothetical protein GEV08_01415 [Acidimicrobiia bacterium]|nr:hypothetical protein [Acidimicrobiia bacterium]